ncbi:TIGR02117 family protein [Sphingomonas sp.]|uniref:TIGR02117 family protein n=1 Tax=Sphingomonas sp. TaxID=28214 RepID=UPI002CCCB681|nr:TIGR02117 family protein [Sphingomonas sp.]HWK35845.1 TIGR02117 family protein [Sphingomonas sp.]
MVAVALLVGGYALAGLIGGAVPANPGWRAPVEGVRIYVEDNGIHTGIVVPVRVAGVDWSDLIRPDHLRDPRQAAHGWRSFGWGDHDFYLNTPDWADVSPATVLRAAIGSRRTVMHVDALPKPRPGANVRSVVLRPDEYRRLAAFIRASFAEPAWHRFGYADYDAFYPARGRYSAVTTCNAWTGAALRAAGVRMGVWTPFPATVMLWLPAS